MTGEPSRTDHVYAPPHAAAGADLAAAVARYLDGAGLMAKTQAVRLSTVDADGWPHASLFSAGDMLAMPDGRIRFAIFSRSATAANLIRDGRLALALSLDGGICELRLAARRLADMPGTPLAMFEADLQETRTHVAPYAAVPSGVTFALHDPEAVLARWERQVAALRAAA